MLSQNRVALRVTSLALGVVAFAQAPWALAQSTPCEDLGLPNPIYGSGGSAITATLGKVAAALAGLDPPITLLFADPGACTGYGYLDSEAGITGALKYWSATGVQSTCTPPSTGVAADFAHMGNPVEVCAGKTRPADIGDFPGPIQTLNLITARASSQKSISAEALYYIFGLGAGEGGVEPWTVDAASFGRRTDSFVHLFLAENIGVPPTAFRVPTDNVKGNNPDTVAAVAATALTSVEAGLGYVSGSAADLGRATVKTLAYQHTGQSCGYWPDSDETSLDKINVRTGQYQLWTPGHFYARVNSGGNIIDERVRALVGWFNGSVEPPQGLDITRIIIESGDIPECAMTVEREGLSGAVSSYAPNKPCGCYFEAIATATTPAACEACSDDSECGGVNPKCQFGFCEAY